MRRAANLETVSGRLVQAMRQDIVSGALAPGARLRVDQLSKRYGASHIPVREALLQLVGERLAVIEPHKGAVLRAVTPKFVADIHDTRTAIESLLARRAAENITDAQCDELRNYQLAYEAAASTRDFQLMSNANMEFHSYLAMVADNEEAAHLLDQGWDLVISLRKRFGIGDDRVSEIIAQHHQIVVAVTARDTSAAIEATRLHCESARDDLLTQMQRAEADSKPPPALLDVE
ncbi:GntR family transcriptional regulator [Jiella pacifica]|nr:GntR family transcriptional regulator [Jiella pacifica]